METVCLDDLLIQAGVIQTVAVNSEVGPFRAPILQALLNALND
jgi:hypothetical protein